MTFSRLLDAVAFCDNFPYTEAEVERTFGRSQRLFVNHVPVGLLTPDVVEKLVEWNDANGAPFLIEDSGIWFAHAKTAAKRSEVVRLLLEDWRATNAFRALKGKFIKTWIRERADGVAFVMERAGTILFGVTAFGVHVNVFTRREGGIKLWCARRSQTKPTWPGLLDQCVAGGIEHGTSVYNTVIKECKEEANMPSTISKLAKNTGAIAYFCVSENGLQPEIQYVFDLEIPEDFVPEPADGEAECFYLWDLDEVKQRMLAGEFKPNCALVNIDFMIRHGYVNAANEPDYLSIIARLHRQIEFPLPRIPME
ncbi:hypothetical protein BZG36_01861 [Bifiguratus adelaidae]|uniref:Nudix hydrolase domain-containing protein n=1 Tax=Bifiguratus adelaidae TaxID=1938954 RepID=A0A261Y2G7_9FUNG|nr:hypothetical protein BZG36_01861 [Bifiguratus adelaidae]